MKQTKVSCDRCQAVAETVIDYWQLAFTREVIIEDITEFHSETWDLCPDCYLIVAPSVIYAVQPLEDDE